MANRDKLLSYLKKQGIGGVFHYKALLKAMTISKTYKIELRYTCNNTNCLLRMPMYCDLSNRYQEYVIYNVINELFKIVEKLVEKSK